MHVWIRCVHDGRPNTRGLPILQTGPVALYFFETSDERSPIKAHYEEYAVDLWSILPDATVRASF